MGTRTVWRGVNECPHDESAWAAFRNYYAPAVFRWAWRRVGNDADAEVVTENVFQKLVRRVRGNPTPIKLDKPTKYVQTVVRSAANDFFNEEKKHRCTRLPDGALEALASEPAQAALENEVGGYAELEEQLEEWKMKYTAAVVQLKASPQFHAESFEVLLRIHRDGEAPTKIEAEKGWSRGYASRVAGRKLKSLVTLMGLPADNERSELILRLMVQKYGDPS